MATETATKPIGQAEDRPLRTLGDSQLVARHLEGHPGAFSELYDRYHDRLEHREGHRRYSNPYRSYYNPYRSYYYSPYTGYPRRGFRFDLGDFSFSIGD